jgi:hypothetical protein
LILFSVMSLIAIGALFLILFCIGWVIATGMIYLLIAMIAYHALGMQITDTIIYLSAIIGLIATISIAIALTRLPEE